MCSVRKERGQGLNAVLSRQQLAMEESMYALVPRPVPPKHKDVMYHSKHPGTLPPTFSTFGVAGTSKPGVSNIGGEIKAASGHHAYMTAHATFGTQGNARKPSQILKNGTGGGGGAVAADAGMQL